MKQFLNKDCMTVAQLMDALKTCPPDAFVRTEGCDCFGNFASIEMESSKSRDVDPDKGTIVVYLMRPHS